MRKTRNFWDVNEDDLQIERTLDPLFSMVSIFNICERWASLGDE